MTYGNPGVFPLIGGSGGSGGRRENALNVTGAGAGGGAILIACPSAMTLAGFVTANGGSAPGSSISGGGGSGGGIRLIADSITGTGELQAVGGVIVNGGNGGDGRIRIETNANTLDDAGDPAYKEGLPGTIPRIFKDSASPTIEAVTLGIESVPVDPNASLDFPGQDVSLTDSGSTTLEITVHNVDPFGAVVEVRVVSAVGTVRATSAAYDSGDVTTSTWLADVDLPDGFSAIDVRVILP